MFFLKLRAKLLEYGGHDVEKTTRGRLMSRRLLAHGEWWNGSSRFRLLKRDGDVHWNAATLHHTHMHHAHWIYGYALTADDVWREHSWLVRVRERATRYTLVETTSSLRRAYYGMIMQERGASRIVLNI